MKTIGECERTNYSVPYRTDILGDGTINGWKSGNKRVSSSMAVKVNREERSEQIPREEKLNTLLVAILEAFRHVTGALAMLNKQLNIIVS